MIRDSVRCFESYLNGILSFGNIYGTCQMGLLNTVTAVTGSGASRTAQSVERAAPRSAAPLEPHKRLIAILEGEPPFDLFIRRGPTEEQPNGWEPDIDDGVQPNIRPFLTQDLPGDKKGAGILRAKLNPHWKKDRGQETRLDETWFPRFWKDGRSIGGRVNNVRLTNTEKCGVRTRGGGK